MEKGPSEPPADGTCFFFKLSAELRNLVYEYALTDEHPLRFERSGNGGEFLTSGESEPNQLRFVNKQLFVETRNLEIRYNDLDFLLPEYASFFLQHCKPANWGHLRILTIHHVKEWVSDLTEKAAMQSILSFCKRSPKALVKARLLAMSPNHPTSIYSMCKAEHAVRGTHTVIDMMYPEATWEKKGLIGCASLSPRWHVYRNIPEVVNFRIFPMDEMFNEADFKHLYEQIQTQTRLLLYTVGNVDDMVKAMKHVVEHGI